MFKRKRRFFSLSQTERSKEGGNKRGRGGGGESFDAHNSTETQMPKMRIPNTTRNPTSGRNDPSPNVDRDWRHRRPHGRASHSAAWKNDLPREKKTILF